MTQPTKPTAPLPALRSDPDTFSARLEANILFWPTHLTFIDESNTFNAGLSAALVAGNLPSLTGNELDAVRVNAAGDGVEFVDVTAAGWTFLSATTTAAQRTALEIPELTQAQAEDAASTVFGQVSGQRLAQANATPYGTLVNTTSGTAFDFTGIPAGVTEITLTLNAVSLNGTDRMLVQIGPAAGIVSTGYVSTASSMAGSVVTEGNTSGFNILVAIAAREGSGVLVLKRLDAGSNVWLASHSVTASADAMAVGAGSVTLAAELTQLRLTRTGSNTFDNGSANISWRY